MSETTSCDPCACGGHEAPTRRDFLMLAGQAFTGVGAAVFVWALIDSMNPSADVRAMASTEVDISGIKEGESRTEMWRGRPVFIRHRTAKDIEEARAASAKDLKDPQTDDDRVKQSVFDGKAMPEWLIVLGSCTHLGCTPLGQKVTDAHGEFGGWFCPCHGSHYDTSGRIRKGPAPHNLPVPPYTFLSATRIKIG